MTTKTYEETKVAPVDIAALRGDAELIVILQRMAALLRERGLVVTTNQNDPLWTTSLGRFATGSPTLRSEVEADLGRAAVEHLVHIGAAVSRRDHLLPAIALAFAGAVPAVRPVHQATVADMVYIGAEAPWLTRLAYRHGPGAGRAADLATGTGIVAVALSARYDEVVAADLLPSAVDCAALTLAINRTDRCRTSAVVADVAAGLTGPFDLIVANCPWVPTDPEPGKNFVYGDGGPTGIELPTRFVSESMDLLAPGGTGIVLVLDSVWSDGRRPVADLVAELEAQRIDVVVEKAPPAIWSDKEDESCRQSYPGCESGQLVALVFTMPTEPPHD